MSHARRVPLPPRHRPSRRPRRSPTYAPGANDRQSACAKNPARAEAVEGQGLGHHMLSSTSGRAPPERTGTPESYTDPSACLNGGRPVGELPTKPLRRVRQTAMTAHRGFSASRQVLPISRAGCADISPAWRSSSSTSAWSQEPSSALRRPSSSLAQARSPGSVSGAGFSAACSVSGLGGGSRAGWMTDEAGAGNRDAHPPPLTQADDPQPRMSMTRGLGYTDDNRGRAPVGDERASGAQASFEGQGGM